MVVIYCYLEIDNHKVLKKYLNNSFFFRIRISLFYALPNSKYCCDLLLEEIQYIFDIPGAIFQQKSIFF